MYLSKLLTLTSLLIGASSAAIIKRDCAATCGSHCYSSDEINAAVQQGYSLEQSGNEAGDYPHEYKDYEGFNFPVPGPYYEFPILADGQTYDGGSPGADRVIFNDSGELAGVITHTGASGDGFVQCQ
ncbi:hypothetical protein VTN96DRAFT_9207 [Rasamsonia emersonii]|uniref:ribonuclease T1 n=1 Tax=Rasamsonia emersonii (strain ATCC 16479 / CBS 393.64 / IMI 116815) TaxID=1408163 RepID=A0A0F4YQ26_RASE3|nr:Uncharacterized protein T310_5609 [Rasamsonia emersonii CBS 393.64]KKA20354.1 Uncharacterized protein T310_5609 [Rasamsonia emersonii CBS 393.64]